MLLYLVKGRVYTTSKDNRLISYIPRDVYEILKDKKIIVAIAIPEECLKNILQTDKVDQLSDKLEQLVYKIREQILEDLLGLSQE